MTEAPLRILLIEDHETTAHTLSRMLVRRGFAVTAVGNAEQAIAAAQDGRFELIVSDIGLPGINGWQLLPRLQELCTGVVAIAVSGFAYDTDLEKSAAAGFHLHLKKPITVNELFMAIETLFPDRSFGEHDTGEHSTTDDGDVTGRGGLRRW